jgi:prepilin-type N-terminal cleavage/methylation domain-containing protein
MTELKQKRPKESGFSLVELLIAMTVSLVLMALASTLLARCIHIRTSEDRSTESLADVQRALNIISREIANAGYGLSSNGIVGCNGANCDSNRNSIRVRANLDGSSDGTMQEGEDIKYFLNDTENTNYLARYDASASGARATVLANRIDVLQFYYFNQRVSYNTVQFNPATPNASLITNVRHTNGTAATEVTPNNARYVVMVVSVRLPSVGRPGQEGYTPERNEMLASDVSLRNSILNEY